MSHIPNQQREIYKIAVGLYAAAPGTSYFAELNGALEAGMSVSGVYQALANAPSFQLQDPAFAPQSTNAQFTTAFLQRLLGTDVTPAGHSFAFNFVFDRLQAGVSRGEVMKIAVDALDAVPSTDPDFGAAAQRLDNRIEVARSFTELLGNASLDIQFLQSTIAGVTNEMASVNAAVAKWSGGLIFDLTPGQDVIGGSFTGNPGNDLFNAPISDTGQQTLNTGDALAGGTGHDTLRATVAEDVLPILASIETVDVRFGGVATLDLSSAPGTEQVIVEASSATGTVQGLGGVGALVVRDQQQHVVFDGLTTPELSLTLQRFGTAGAFNDVVLGTAHPITVARLDLTLLDTNAQLKIGNVGPPPTVTIDASGANTLRFGSPTAGVNTLEIIGSGSVDLTGAPLTDLMSLAAQSSTGAIAINVDASAINVATGAGADTVTYGEPISGNTQIDLGAGDDLLVLNGASAPGAHIKGGAGNDSLKTTKGEWIDASAPGVYSGFETLDIGGGAGTYVMSRLPGVHDVAITGGAPKGAVTLLDAAPETTLTRSNPIIGAPTAGDGRITFLLHDATGKNDTLHLTFATVDMTSNPAASVEIAGVALALPGIEVLDIASSVIADPGVPNIAYRNNVFLTGAQLDTLRLTGNAFVAVLDSSAEPTSIRSVDASLSLGGINFFGNDQNVPVNFVGSEVRDFFSGTKFGDTIDAGGAGDTITLGRNGGVDRLIYHAGDSLQMYLVHPASSIVINEPLFDTIENFSSGTTPQPFQPGAPADLIDLSAFSFSDVQRSAITDKGTIDAPSLEGSTPFQPGWFIGGGVAHALAIGTHPTPGAPFVPNTDVFVDVNNDGDFEIQTDLYIELFGVQGLTLNNFVF